MNLTLYSFALAMAAMCFSVAIVLLAYRRGDEDAYVYRARFFLALSLLVETVCDADACWLILAGEPLTLLDQYVIPASFFVQVFLIGAHLLSLLRAHYTVQRLLKFMVVLFVVSTLANIVCYFMTMETLTLAHYKQYAGSDVGNVIRYILYSYCIVSLVACSWKVIPHVNSRAHHVLRMQRGLASAQCFQTMIYVYLVAFLVGLADITVLNTNYLILLVLMCCLLASAIMTLSIVPATRAAGQSSATVPAGHTSAPSSAHSRPRAKVPRTTPAQHADGYSAQVEKAIEEWCRRDDKPFMRTSVTLKDTARDMGVGARVLSDFLNTVYECNFNRWINMLRIDEVKRLMETQSQLTMAELSQMAGFTDASAMAKIFKRIVGETPSEYKNRVTETGGEVSVEKEG